MQVSFLLSKISKGEEKKSLTLHRSETNKYDSTALLDASEIHFVISDEIV